jgi:hypothetical protein
MKLIFEPASLATGFWSRLFARVVAAVTKGNFQHCEIWIDGPSVFAYCFSSALAQGGTRYINRDVRGWSSIDIPNTETVTRSDVYAAINLALRATNEPYDVLGLLAFVVPFRTHVPGEAFCSAADLQALEALKDANLNNPPWTYSPNDLARWCVEMWGGKMEVIT